MDKIPPATISSHFWNSLNSSWGYWKVLQILLIYSLPFSPEHKVQYKKQYNKQCSRTGVTELEPPQVYTYVGIQ